MDGEVARGPQCMRKGKNVWRGPVQKKKKNAATPH